MRPPRPARLAVLIVAAGILAAAAAFVGLRLATPSDGARFEPGQAVWRADGVVVTPLQEQPGGLRRGDVVVAVDGRRMEAWARALFNPVFPRPRWQIGQTVPYTVVRDGRTTHLAVPLAGYPLGAVLLKGWSTILYGLVFQLVAAFVFIRRPDDRAARVLFLAGASILGATTWSFGLQVSDLVGGLGFWLYKITSTGAFTLFWVALLHFALVFPRPHSIVVNHPSIIPLIYVAPYTLYFAYLAAVEPGASSTLDLLGRLVPADLVPALLCLTLAIGFTVWGYHGAEHDAVTRQKLRWIVFAGLVSGGGGLLLWVLPGVILGRPIISTDALGLLALPFPLVLAIAILRYQLFDIDVVINRTLVYGTLSLLLGMLYAGSVLLLHHLFRPVIGAGNDLAAVASTLAIVALFQPLRRRIQAFIDRRFYRRKYDAARTLEAFSAKVREEVDLETLTGDLLAVVEETMQPAHVSLWLRDLPVSRHPDA